MKRVYLGVFGSGLGHASRLMAVSRNLVGEGCELRFSSSGESREYIRRQGFVCNDIPLVDVVFTDTGVFSAKETLKVAPLLFVRVFQQAGIEARNILNFRPDVVLSDSLISTVMASKLTGVKCVTVLNQLRLLSSPKTPRIASKLLTNGSITIGNEFWELSERILFPDLPPPYTISEQNLSGTGSAGTRAQFIGFLTPPRSYAVDTATSEIIRSPRKMIFWQISGPERTRTTLLPKVKRVAIAMKDECLSVISAGNPSGDTTPRPFEAGFVYEWCQSKDALIDRCDVFVSRAGHVTISDLILRGKPSVLIPIQGQMEQIGNAMKAEKLGVAVEIDEENFAEVPFREALARLLTEETAKKTAWLKGYAAGFDADRAVVSALNSQFSIESRTPLMSDSFLPKRLVAYFAFAPVIESAGASSTALTLIPSESALDLTSSSWSRSRGWRTFGWSLNASRTATPRHSGCAPAIVSIVTPSSHPASLSPGSPSHRGPAGRAPIRPSSSRARRTALRPASATRRPPSNARA